MLDATKLESSRLACQEPDIAALCSKGQPSDGGDDHSEKPREKRGVVAAGHREPNTPYRTYDSKQDEAKVGRIRPFAPEFGYGDPYEEAQRPDAEWNGPGGLLALGGKVEADRADEEGNDRAYDKNRPDEVTWTHRFRVKAVLGATPHGNRMPDLEQPRADLARASDERIATVRALPRPTPGS